MTHGWKGHPYRKTVAVRIEIRLILDVVPKVECSVPSSRITIGGGLVHWLESPGVSHCVEKGDIAAGRGVPLSGKSTRDLRTSVQNLSNLPEQS